MMQYYDVVVGYNLFPFQLPLGTTWQMLRDKCRDAGDVKFSEMKSKDTGIVQFGSHWDAQRAISILL